MAVSALKTSILVSDSEPASAATSTSTTSPASFAHRSSRPRAPSTAARKSGRSGWFAIAAFAAAQPRIFAADVETPAHSCGALEGKAEETAKCAAIGVLGCVSANPLVCGVSAGLAVLCTYLVDKTCEADPDSCQPGWTEG